jgi:hypothetical protein
MLYNVGWVWFLGRPESRGPRRLQMLRPSGNTSAQAETGVPGADKAAQIAGRKKTMCI